MAENSSSSPIIEEAPIVVVSSESESAGSEDTASGSSRYTQRRKTQRVNGDPPEEEDAVMGTGAASSGALTQDILAVNFAGQPEAVPNGVSDLTSTTNQHSVTGIQGTTSPDLYPQTTGSPSTQLHVRLLRIVFTYVPLSSKTTEHVRGVARWAAMSSSRNLVSRPSTGRDCSCQLGY